MGAATVNSTSTNLSKPHEILLSGNQSYFLHRLLFHHLWLIVKSYVNVSSQLMS